ncbi:PREDICTED: 23.2 kDa heat shock protein [Tarenaya hassleriana]|uniref:23.2 kDa heat shock protein n=1 Tax=Tarenaya hassleriana TaxID=28532 RepID=UPI00053C31E6|nr:PREDICTED: 23.2 kDa heat shock protein [Tarenaya hassleriana]
MSNLRTDRIYQDFDPITGWTSEPGVEILVVHLPGFHKEQLKVAVTPTRKLRLTGERPAGGNRWIRFRQEIPLPTDVDADSISAMFKDGKLYVRNPKTNDEKPETEALTPPNPPVPRTRDPPEAKRDDHSLKSIADNQRVEPGLVKKWSGKYEGMVKEVKNKRHMMCNLVGVFMLVLLILLYAKNAVNSSHVGKFD